MPESTWMLFACLLITIHILSGARCSKEACEKSLGMEKGEITDDQLSASSCLYCPAFSQFRPTQARLKLADSTAQWCAADNDRDPFIQVDLNMPTRISGLTTQGIKSEEVFKFIYQLWYRTDTGLDWKKARSSEGHENFTGHTNVDNHVYNEFPRAVIAKTLRIVPLGTSRRQRCFRFELHGCPWRKGPVGLIQYSIIPEEVLQENAEELFDPDFDGVWSFQNSSLQGGLGMLTDDLTGEVVGNSYPSHGWLISSQLLTLTFKFSGIRHLKQIAFHLYLDSFSLRPPVIKGLWGSVDGLGFKEIAYDADADISDLKEVLQEIWLIDAEVSLLKCVIAPESLGTSFAISEVDFEADEEIITSTTIFTFENPNYLTETQAHVSSSPDGINETTLTTPATFPSLSDPTETITTYSETHSDQAVLSYPIVIAVVLSSVAVLVLAVALLHRCRICSTTVQRRPVPPRGPPPPSKILPPKSAALLAVPCVCESPSGVMYRQPLLSSNS